MDAKALQSLKMAQVIAKAAEVLAKHPHEKVAKEPEIANPGRERPLRRAGCWGLALVHCGGIPRPRQICVPVIDAPEFKAQGLVLTVRYPLLFFPQPVLCGCLPSRTHGGLRGWPTDILEPRRPKMDRAGDPRYNFDAAPP